MSRSSAPVVLAHWTEDLTQYENVKSFIFMDETFSIKIFNGPFSLFSKVFFKPSDKIYNREAKCRD